MGKKMPFSKNEEPDFEERYHNASEENLLLKRTINQQLKLIKKLNASLQWYSKKDTKDNERLPSRDPGEECRLRELETSNKILANKVKVLKQQLISLSSFHATTRLPSSRGVSPSKESVLSLPTKRSKSTSTASNFRNHGDGMTSMVFDDKINGPPLFTIDEDLGGLRDENHLGNFMEADPGIRPDSAESVGDASSKLMVNVEFIRMKRMMKWQNAQLTTLLPCVDNLRQESQLMKETMTTLSEENVDLKNSLSFERKKYNMLQNNSASKEQIKVLEEQIRDLQGERNALYNHNKKLLSLAAVYESQKVEHVKLLSKQTRDAVSQTSFDPSPEKEQTTLQSSGPSQQKIQRKHKYNSLSNEELSIGSKHSKQDILSDLFSAHDCSSASSVILDTDDGLSGQKHSEPMDLDPMDSSHSLNLTYSKHSDDKFVENSNLKRLARKKKTKTETKKDLKSLIDSVSNLNDSSAKEDSEKPVIKTVDRPPEKFSNHEEEVLRAELSTSLCELERCRQMLKIQCNLNAIYKEEVEKLASQVKKEEAENEGAVSAVEVLLKEHLAKIEKFQTAKHVRSHEQQTDSVEFSEKLQVPKGKFVNRTVEITEEDGSSKFTKDERLEPVMKNLAIEDKVVETCIVLSGGDALDDTAAESSKSNAMLNTESDCQFELHVHRLDLTNYSFTPKTQLFLTWSFLDQDEHAYSPIKGANDLDFSCSCSYKGPCSKELLQYLTNHGVVIEIYQVVGEGCIKIAEVKIDTSIAVKSTSNMHYSKTSVTGQIITGVLHTSFLFICSSQLMEEFLAKNDGDEKREEVDVLEQKSGIDDIKVDQR